jgi:hypothetical protein
MFEATHSVLGMRNLPVSVSYLRFLISLALYPLRQWLTYKVSRMAAAIMLAAAEDSQEGVALQSVTICVKVLGVDCLL